MSTRFRLFDVERDLVYDLYVLVETFDGQSRCPFEVVEGERLGRDVTDE